MRQLVDDMHMSRGIARLPNAVIPALGPCRLAGRVRGRAAELKERPAMPTKQRYG